MDRRDFMTGAAAAVVTLAGTGATVDAAEPEFVSARLLSVTLPATYRGASFTITNNGLVPITIVGAPTETILAPGEMATLPDSSLRFAGPEKRAAMSQFTIDVP